MWFAYILGLSGFLSISLFSQNAPVPAEVPTRGAALPAKLKAAAPKLAARYTAELIQAEAGDALAQHEVSELLEWGQGVPVNLPRAFEWAKKSAAAGHALGRFRVGLMYRFGTGVEPDEKKSNEYLKQAAPACPHSSRRGMLRRRVRWVCCIIAAGAGWRWTRQQR